jgi:hypothetical protein
MATASNPLAQMVMSALQNRSAQAAPGMSGQGASMLGAMGGQLGQGGPGDDYAKQVADLKGADPSGINRQLKAIKQILAIMAVSNMERLPNVSGQLYKIIPMFDRVLKEVQQASSVDMAVRNPIQMSAAQPPQAGQQNFM